MYNIINALLFYFGWLFIVKMAAWGLPEIGILAAIGLVVFHLFSIQEKFKELVLVFTLVFAGFFIESALLYFQLIRYSSPNTVLIGFAPFWILGIYAIFATTINHCLRFLDPYLFLASILGFIAGAFSYSAGQYLEACQLLIARGGSAWVIGIVWFILTPSIFLYNRWLFQRQHKP